MPPALRIGFLAAFAAVLPIASLVEHGAIAAVLLAAHFQAGRLRAWRALGAALWRLRWLLGALALLYVGFTEGAPLWDALPGLSREGALEGGRRALVLVNLIAAVQLLRLTTPLPALLEGLQALLRPLRALGVDVDRLGRRIGLVIEELGRLERMPRGGGALDTLVAMSRDIEARARRAEDSR